MPVSATTTLPSVVAPDLGNGVEDEISVGTFDVLNNGQYRIQARESEATAWDSSAAGWAELLETAPSPEAIVNGREDGEGYEVRLRYETAYRTGSWASSSIVTLFPGASGLSATSVGQTSITLSWTDNADNEDGQRVIRERHGKDGNWWPESVLEDVGADTTSYTDDSVSPGNEYRYRIRAYTEHTSADSNLETVTTDSYGGAQSRRIPTNGPYVEVEAADGTTRTPAVLEINPSPSLNDHPRIEVSVPRDESWQNDRWDEATMRVWRDGERLPIDQLERPEVTPSETVLYGIGGSELDQYVETEVDFQTVHQVAETLLANETPMPYQIDDPGGATDQVEQDYQAGASGPALPLPFDGALTNDATDPVHVADDGAVELSKTTHFVEGEAVGDDVVIASDYADSPDFSRPNTSLNPAAAQVAYQTFVWQFELNHEIPAENLAIDIRRHLVDPGGEMAILIDDTLVGIPETRSGTGSGEPLEWISDVIGSNGYSGTPEEPPTLEPGTHTLEIDIRDYTAAGETFSVAGDWNIDAVALYDDRYPPTLPSATNADSILEVESIYPASETARFTREEPFGAVTAANLSTTWTNGDVSANQAIALSNDRGDSWTEGTNTASLDVTFDEFGPSIEFRATISALSSGGLARTATQALEAATVTVDTSGSPIVEGKVLRGPLVEVLQQLANRGDVLFEVQTFDSGDPGVVWAYPGQRTADVEPDLIDYSVSKKPMERITTLRIAGRSEMVTNEPFTADTAGTILTHDSIKEGSETIRDPDTGDVLERGDDADYTMTYAIGEVRMVVGGAMTEGNTYEIDYEWQPSATIARPTPDGELLRKRSRAIPELTSEQECEEAANFLLRELEPTPWDATVTISDAVGWQLIAAVDPDQLPGSGPYRVRSIDETPETATLELGRGKTVGEAVQELRGRLSSTEREV